MSAPDVVDQHVAELARTLRGPPSVAGVGQGSSPHSSSGGNAISRRVWAGSPLDGRGPVGAGAEQAVGEGAGRGRGELSEILGPPACSRWSMRYAALEGLPPGRSGSCLRMTASRNVNPSASGICSCRTSR